jgi:hypothetical protein
MLLRNAIYELHKFPRRRQRVTHASLAQLAGLAACFYAFPVPSSRAWRVARAVARRVEANLFDCEEALAAISAGA